MDRLSSRAIRGMFYRTLAEMAGMSWTNLIAMEFESDQGSEEYAWLGMVPQMREWIGGRQAKSLRDDGITIKNLEFEATIRVMRRHLRRDKTGQIEIRIAELAQRAQSHWAKLLSTLLLNGTSAVCYDGQFFFDVDHQEGKSGVQSNDITIDISALPANVNGTPANPSIEEMQQVILKMIVQMLSFKDDQGEPLNEDATSFLVMAPPALSMAVSNALKPEKVGELNSMLPTNGMSVGYVVNPRLSAWTDSFALFRTDARTKPMIMQNEEDPRFSEKSDGSEFEFDNNEHEYGVNASRNVGYGMWQQAVYGQMV